MGLAEGTLMLYAILSFLTLLTPTHASIAYLPEVVCKNHRITLTLYSAETADPEAAFAVLVDPEARAPELLLGAMKWHPTDLGGTFEFQDGEDGGLSLVFSGVPSARGNNSTLMARPGHSETLECVVIQYEGSSGAHN